MRRNTSLPVRQELADGSFLSTFAGVPARVVKYMIEGSDEPLYRLPTTLADPQRAPAVELAALYHEHWEIETACDEIKTPLPVHQEIEGLMLARYAVRSFLQEAALEADEDPDRLSFTHAVNVVRRRIQNPGVSPLGRQRALEQALRAEILEERAARGEPTRARERAAAP